MSAQDWPLLWQVVACFVLGFGLELTVAAYTVSLTRHKILRASILSLICPFWVMLDWHLFIGAQMQEQALLRQLLLTLGTGLGYASATATVMKLIPKEAP